MLTGKVYPSAAMTALTQLLLARVYGAQPAASGAPQEIGPWETWGRREVTSALSLSDSQWVSPRPEDVKKLMLLILLGLVFEGKCIPERC
jgi:hypothetical protein